MTIKLKWKRSNVSRQVMSTCGRYWMSLPDKNNSSCTLWHDDTGVKLNTFIAPALAKDYAQSHLDNFRTFCKVMQDGVQPLRRDDGYQTAEELLKTKAQLVEVEDKLGASTRLVERLEGQLMQANAIIEDYALNDKHHSEL